MHSHMHTKRRQRIRPMPAAFIILYGSQTGNAESVAKDAANMAKSHGLKPVVKSMDEVEIGALTAMDCLLIITSTYGEGEMPDNAQMLWDSCAETRPALKR